MENKLTKKEIIKGIDKLIKNSDGRVSYRVMAEELGIDGRLIVGNITNQQKELNNSKVY